MKRRSFLQSMAAAATAGTWASSNVTLGSQEPGKLDSSLVILHTNDTHSHLDPLSSRHSRNAGLGGAARRAHLIKQIRQKHQHVLLLDSGDMLQGTPYFNLFGGEVEFKAMSAMGYDVATLGNHEFDNGVAGLVKQMPHAKFEFVNANYRMTGSPLADHVRPYTIREFGALKVGIFGLGIAFEGLILPSAHEGISYEDPVLVGRTMVEQLRQAGCNFIVCLSHLGHRHRGDKVDDLALAAEVSGIDLVLGGHTHTFLDKPEIVNDPASEPTMIHQVGCFGVRLGRIDVRFNGASQKSQQVAGHYTLNENTKLT